MFPIAAHCQSCTKPLTPDLHGDPLPCPCGSREVCSRETPCSTCAKTRLESMRGRGTRYEVAAELGSRRVLVGYVGRRSQKTLRGLMRDNGEKLVALTGTDLFDLSVNGYRMGEWLVRFTGRTQRDAVVCGELEAL